MNTLKLVATCALVASSLVACDDAKKPEPTKPATTAAAESTAKAAPAASAEEGDAKMDAVDIPTPESFEDEAAEKVNDDNAESELDAIEKDLDADKE
jgi:hypothetical protein